MATRKKPADPKLRILALDPELSPYRSDLKLRMRLYGEAKKKLTTNGSLSDFANGSLYYGLHKGRNGWYYREWAPAAEKMSLIGDLNGWDPSGGALYYYNPDKTSNQWIRTRPVIKRIGNHLFCS